MDNKNYVIQFFVELSRLIVGATFMFSGFTKAIDPMGFAYKIQDYLISFGLTNLFALALPMAIVMIVAEFSIGVFVLSGIYRKFSAIAASLFMLFFLPLTLWIAIKNPVKDCGCFGDAWVISNWATFYKNILLSVCSATILVFWRRMTPVFSMYTAWMTALFGILFGLFFSIYNVLNLPVFDFRSYKIGDNIPLNMYVDPSNTDLYENIFIYSKDGVSKEFTMDNYPWNDSTWVFEDMQVKLIREGEKPEIEDFSIHSLSGDIMNTSSVETSDITTQILSDTTYTFLMVSPILHEMNERHLAAFNQVNQLAQEQGLPFYLLTSSTTEQIAEWYSAFLLSDKAAGNAPFQFCHADERVLKTMIRSNPGLILLKEGTVVNKWADNEVKRVAKNMQNNDFEKLTKPNKNIPITLVVIIVLFLLPIIWIKYLDYKIVKEKSEV